MPQWQQKAIDEFRQITYELLQQSKLKDHSKNNVAKRKNQSKHNSPAESFSHFQEIQQLKQRNFEYVLDELDLIIKDPAMNQQALYERLQRLQLALSDARELILQIQSKSDYEHKLGKKAAGELPIIG